MSSIVRPAERLLRALEVTGIEYVLVGSVASSAFGEPRATMDIDMVARLSRPLLVRLGGLLGEDYSFDLESAEAALRPGGSVPFVWRVMRSGHHSLRGGGWPSGIGIRLGDASRSGSGAMSRACRGCRAESWIGPGWAWGSWCRGCRDRL